MAIWKAAGKDFALVFDYPSWKELEKKVCILPDVDENLTSADRLTWAVRIAVVLAREGFRLGIGDEPPTAEALEELLVPKEGAAVFPVINRAFAEGFAMESSANNSAEGTVIDETLMEIEKKETPDA